VKHRESTVNPEIAAAVMLVILALSSGVSLSAPREWIYLEESDGAVWLLNANDIQPAMYGWSDTLTITSGTRRTVSAMSCRCCGVNGCLPRPYETTSRMGRCSRRSITRFGMSQLP
jgi:hypothetical protein